MEHSARMWIVVAHESGYRIFSRLGPRSRLELVEKVDHPIGRAKNGELKSDAPGSDEGWGPSGNHHRFDKRISPTEKNAIDFAKEIAVALDKFRDLNRFEYLVLVAGSKFLGEIQKHLPKPTVEKVVVRVNQNLGTIGDQEVPSHLTDILEDFDRSEGLKSA